MAVRMHAAPVSCRARSQSRGGTGGSRSPKHGVTDLSPAERIVTPGQVRGVRIHVRGNSALGRREKSPCVAVGKACTPPWGRGRKGQRVPLDTTPGSRGRVLVPRQLRTRHPTTDPKSPPFTPPCVPPS